MSLRDDLRAQYDNAQLRLPADVRGIMKRNADDLAASGLAGHALGAGARAPQFTLASAAGTKVTLDALLAEGPVVLTFYRGACCLSWSALAFRTLTI
jgi:hypothetical protein